MERKCDRSARRARFGIPPRRLYGHGGAVVAATNDAAPTEDPDAETTETQLPILSAASEHDVAGLNYQRTAKATRPERPLISSLALACLRRSAPPAQCQYGEGMTTAGQRRFASLRAASMR
jgi:hypothetical protein